MFVEMFLHDFSSFLLNKELNMFVRNPDLSDSLTLVLQRTAVSFYI